MVAQLEEGFEIPGLLAYVNELESRVVFELRLYLCAVGAGGHYVNCNHGFYCFRVEHLWVALAFGRRELGLRDEGSAFCLSVLCLFSEKMLVVEFYFLRGYTL